MQGSSPRGRGQRRAGWGSPVSCSQPGGVRHTAVNETHAACAPPCPSPPAELWGHRGGTGPAACTGEWVCAANARLPISPSWRGRWGIYRPGRWAECPVAGGEEQAPLGTDVTSVAEEGLGSGDGTV